MAKKGNKMKQLIKSTTTPKGFVVAATGVLAIVIGAFAISSFASSPCTVSGSSATCKTGQYVSKSFSKRFCAKATTSSSQPRGKMTIGGSQITLNGNFNPICTRGSGSFRFDSLQGTYKVSWYYY